MSSLRVGLDLDGSLESLSNSMSELAAALRARDDLTLLTFRTQTRRHSPDEERLALRAMWAPWWRRSRGRSLDTLLGPLDVVHVAGLAIPPTRSTPLLVTVDDLRPLREARASSRVRALRRAVARGAVVVVSSRAARHEAMEVMEFDRPEIVVVRPPVGRVSRTSGGSHLVVSVAGDTPSIVSMAPDLEAFVARHDCGLVIVASASVHQALRARGVRADFVERRRGVEALASARCALHLSDGARFPSFAVAALAAGVPTVAHASEINRELLGGAATLLYEDDDVVEALQLLGLEAHRHAQLAQVAVRAGDLDMFEFH